MNERIAALVERFYSDGEGLVTQWRHCRVCRGGVQWDKATPRKQPTTHVGDCPVSELEAALRADADAGRVPGMTVSHCESARASENAEETSRTHGPFCATNCPCGLGNGPADADARPPQEWRCFHCDEVFTDKAEAQEHFGENIDDDPLCRIKADEGGLAGEVRRLQAELADAYNQRNSYENDARLWHEAEADRRRRIGNIQWWQEIDSREGEKLVLQERVRELEAAAGVPRRAEPPRWTDEESAAIWQCLNGLENHTTFSARRTCREELERVLGVGFNTAVVGRAEPLKETT